MIFVKSASLVKADFMPRAVRFCLRLTLLDSSLNLGSERATFLLGSLDNFSKFEGVS